MTERLGMMPILGGNDVELIVDTYEVIDRLIEDIDRACDHIHLMFYIIADDHCRAESRRCPDTGCQARCDLPGSLSTRLAHEAGSGISRTTCATMAYSSKPRFRSVSYGAFFTG